MVIYWDEDFFGANQSTVQLGSCGEFVITTFSPVALPLFMNYPVFGVTDACDYLSVFSARCIEANANSKSHDYDCANCVRRPEAGRATMTSYKTVQRALEYYLGDIKIESSNPLIDSIEVISDSLTFIAQSIDMECLEDLYYEATLFSSDFIEIKLIKSGNKTKCANGNQDIQYSYRLVFNFSSPQHLSFAADCWVSSIWNLLSIVSGGVMPIADHVVRSKSLGGSFRCGLVPSVQIEGKKPEIDSLEISLGKLHPIDYQKMISAWMERPSTLRGMAPEFLATRYGDLYAHSKLLVSMRGVESAFADGVLSSLVIEKGFAKSAEGLYDINDGSCRPVKKALEGLQRSPYFAEKLSFEIKRFEKLLLDLQEHSIDWDGFVKSAKDFRNAKAHGTFIGGTTPNRNYEMAVVIRTCQQLFALAVIGLGYDGDDKIPHPSGKANSLSDLGAELHRLWPAS